VICHLLIVVYNEKKGGGWMEDGGNVREKVPFYI
jgi:hypothetical protein